MFEKTAGLARSLFFSKNGNRIFGVYANAMKTNLTPIMVRAPYRAQYTDPIILAPGDDVRLGAEETDPNWKGWIWAETDTYKGWIPMQILEMNATRTLGRVIKAYSAKELDVDEGQSVFALYSLNGWTWARHTETKEEGWIPNEILDTRACE